MELIYKKDALHAVLHNQGDAAVAAVQEIEPVKVAEWVSCKERLPEQNRMVLTAIYTTDLIWQKDGETIEETAARVQAEAAAHPRREMGAWNEDDGWYEILFGAPMGCAPSYWLEIPPMPPLPDAPERD